MPVLCPFKMEKNKHWTNKYLGFFFSEYKCLYSPWVDLDPCAMTCINGYKIKVRTYRLVSKDTARAKECNETLIKKVNCSSPTCK